MQNQEVTTFQDLTKLNVRSITVTGSKLRNKLPQEVKNKLNKGYKVFIKHLKKHLLHTQ